jgi:hypothetical protein
MVRKKPYFGNIQTINGYNREISGENIDYFSAFPDHATRALLTRTTDGTKTIEWETAPAPQKNTGPYVYFNGWFPHSSGTSGGPRNFDLYINDQKALTLTTYLPINVRLGFHSRQYCFCISPDENGWSERFLWNCLFTSSYQQNNAGKPLRLKLVGQAQNSRDWFMTYKFI